ncbi:hypothetical protein TGAM01_v210845 [Trichoderma gamsii]|uniref:Ice-binding protein n=1 Tax=Trichoderma gamsii TaxID=398673 RepID=A0A2P4Z7M3_9HYPO|nr:hypothetical protein TGAM01_v210845 [Trichoderma gamsii]PON20294.1 hypothetical protein TGAM01_v210845 [Trichoderma gamsii]
MLCLRLLGSAIAFTSVVKAQVNLGTALSFAVLGGSAVTNTGPSIISGNVGVYPGSAISGFPPGIVVNGVIHMTDAVAAQAQADVTTAYNVAAGLPPNTDLTGQDLGGMTLVAGVYSFSTSAQLTGALVLDGQGDSSSVWVFQIGSTLTTATASSVILIGGASPCNVFWQVGSSATIGTTTTFVGNVLALTSITLVTGATTVSAAFEKPALCKDCGTLTANSGAHTKSSSKLCPTYSHEAIPVSQVDEPASESTAYFQQNETLVSMPAVSKSPLPYFFF